MFEISLLDAFLKLGGAASDNFCNFPKLTNQQALPLYTANGKVCEGEEVRRNIIEFESLFTCTTMQRHKCL